MMAIHWVVRAVLFMKPVYTSMFCPCLNITSAWAGMLTLDCCVHAALSSQDNGKRPGRYILLQEMEKRIWEDRVTTSLDKAFALKKRLGRRRWQDVLAEVHAKLIFLWFMVAEWRHMCVALSLTTVCCHCAGGRGKAKVWWARGWNRPRHWLLKLAFS